MIVSNAEDQQALGASASATEHELEQLQRELDMVRQVFRQFPSLIAALKHAIAVFRKDPDWTRVRPPLVRLSSEQGDALVAELARVGFSRQLIVG
jgi:4-hydroxy-tetrahydrodipicolinate synthase